MKPRNELNPGRAAKIAAVEARVGEPFWVHLHKLAQLGLSRRAAAKQIDYDWSRFCLLLKSKDAPELPWREWNEHALHSARTIEGLKRAPPLGSGDG